MRQCIFIILSVLCPFLTMAQQNDIANFYEKYSDLENVNTLSLSGSILQFTVAEGDQKSKEAVNKISNMRLLHMEQGNKIAKQDIYKLYKNLRKDQFEDLIKVREGSSIIDIMIQEEKDVITNVLLIVNGIEDFIMISLEGRLDLNDLQHLDFDVEGGNHFKKVSKKQGIPRA